MHSFSSVQSNDRRWNKGWVVLLIFLFLFIGCVQFPDFNPPPSNPDPGPYVPDNGTEDENTNGEDENTGTPDEPMDDTIPPDIIPPDENEIPDVIPPDDEVETETVPPQVLFTVEGQDGMFLLHYIGVNPKTLSQEMNYTLIGSLAPSLLKEMVSEDFDTPPLNTAIIPLDAGEDMGYSLLGYVFIPSPGFLRIGNVPNHTTFAFRLRACDKENPSNCTITPIKSATTKMENYSAFFGEVQTIFDWDSTTNGTCSEIDIPDGGARAIRLPDQSIYLIAGNDRGNYPLVGSDLDHLTHSCNHPALVSPHQQDMTAFNDYYWIYSMYREGSRIHALIHIEVHDLEGNKEVCLPGLKFSNCMYKGIGYAYSDDNGKTFTLPASPHHMVAAMPDPWDASKVGGPLQYTYGYFSPTNIVKKEEYYYSIFQKDPSFNGFMGSGLCVMRTSDIGNPLSWRAWDGKGFNLTMYPPYDYSNGLPGIPQPTEKEACASLSPNLFPISPDSLTYNTYFGRYLLTGMGVFPKQGGGFTCGIYSSLSPDLINWSQPHLLLEHELANSNCLIGDYEGSIAYPSLIDPQDSTVNLEQSDASGQMYYTLFRDTNNFLNRDLVRRNVQFVKG
ncbi:MAG: hypothetical protein V1776_01490 [Candidatus Diapherotrites archaeon]